MQDKLIIYYYTITNAVFDSAGNLLGNSIVSAFLNNTVTLEIHYVTDTDSDNPEEWGKWTGVAGKAIASSLAMDTDYKHAVKGSLEASLSGQVTSIAVKADAVSYSYTGTIELTNSSGQKETVEYTSVKYADGVYTFTVNTTLVNTYEIGDSVRIPDDLMLKLEGESVDDSRADEGIFSFNMYLLSNKILESLDYNSVASLQVIAQHKIISEGNIINTFEFPFQINNVLDFGNETEVDEQSLSTIATKAYVISFARVKFVYQYSSDGSSWHDSYQTGDLYFRVRNDISDSVWSDAQNIFVGPKGDQGEKGDTGGIFTPSVSEDGTLSWTNNANLPNPDPIVIRGTDGFMSEAVVFSASEAYPVGKIVSWTNSEGLTSCYQVITATSAGETPETASSKFRLIASHGGTGPQGPQGGKGATGDQGPKGDTGFLDTVETLDPVAPGYEAGSVVTFGTPVECYQVVTTTSTGETPVTVPEKFHKIAGAGGQGIQGKSDYDIWLENGNSGSETDFLEYLRGKAFSEEFTSVDIPSDGANKGKLTFSTYGIPVSISDNEGTTYPLQFGSYSIQSGVVKIDMENNLSAIGKAVTGTWKVNFASGGGDDMGMEIVESSGTSFTLVNGKVYTHTLSAAETLVFDTSGFRAGICATCELWLTMPSSVVSFSFPETLVWVDGSAPSIDAGNTHYVIVLRWDGSRLIANLAYTVEVA